MNQQISAYSQKLLLQIGRKIRRTLDIEAIWRQTVNSLGQTLGVSRCIICPYESSSSQVKVTAEYCLDGFSRMLGIEIPLTEAPHFTQALATLEPVSVEFFAADDPFQRKSVLTLATAYQEQPNGVICLHWCGNEGCEKKTGSRSWTQAQIEFAQELADQVGSAIALATLYQQRSNRAAEIAQLKKQFLLSASHELRTPLNHIIGYLQLAIDDRADDPIEERAFIQEAHRSAVHLSKVIASILDWMQLNEGYQIDVDLVPIQLNEGCRIHADLAAVRSQEKSLDRKQVEQQIQQAESQPAENSI